MSTTCDVVSLSSFTSRATNFAFVPGAIPPNPTVIVPFSILMPDAIAFGSPSVALKMEARSLSILCTSELPNSSNSDISNASRMNPLAVSSKPKPSYERLTAEEVAGTTKSFDNPTSNEFPSLSTAEQD